MGKYIEHLDKIHMIQKYIEELAKQSKVPIIENYGIDNTVSEILEILFKRVRAEFSKIRS
jgi:2-phosphoglycerate kinase